MAEHDTSFTLKPLTEKEKAKQYQDSVKTYEGFLNVTKWTIIVVAAILILLYLVFIF